MQELYGLGARRIGVIGFPPIGCVPSQRTISGGIQRACSDSEKQAAILFNTKLLSQMDALKEPNSKVQNKTMKRLCNKQVIVTVNGCFPGPRINVREGDTVIVMY
ncbi:SGNH hydrolase superfamily [Sesbania bispinosa]|nr:SGNH hydrolase superfamily [Sesbania bispinosa]